MKKFSLRMPRNHNTVTSINIPKEIIALYCLFQDFESKSGYACFLDFINSIKHEWPATSPNNFNKFVIQKVITSVLSEQDQKLYDIILSELKQSP